MKSVLLGMSGGVDSSVAAALLKQEGYQVIGITMVLIPNNEEETVKDAKTVADFLGIEHRVLHLEEEFRNKVILPFIDSYQEEVLPILVFCVMNILNLVRCISMPKKMVSII